VFLITWQQKLRRPDKRCDHGTPIPDDLNVSGHRQHGVFSGKNWPVQTNGYPARGWGGATSLIKKCRTHWPPVCLRGWRCCHSVRQKCPAINSGYGIVPTTSGKDLKVRYPDQAALR